MHEAALISVSLAFSQTPVHTDTGTSDRIARCAFYVQAPSFRLYSLRLPTKGWPGSVDLGPWLVTYRDGLLFTAK